MLGTTVPNHQKASLCITYAQVWKARKTSMSRDKGKNKTKLTDFIILLVIANFLEITV